MVRKYFGTDGIRGKANEGAMTAETALRVGMAAGRVFRRGDHRHRVVIGKDTRLSGYMLEPALTAGFTSMGMDVFLFGPLPTTYRKNKRHCCKVSDEAAFCLIQRPYISKTLLT
ncbi:hypothetical protein SBT10_26825, partial [Klebsiella pneumoniae]|nr:hypothetical protein [Klebsiella pneumoniae]MDW5750260.1 hypothetical protein [Klebsiella pneumoniae]MDW5819950.1 hypothetical protein [Klebsiella pneumoniae]